MPLRPAHRGYRYQDFMCARILLQQLFEQGNPIIRFDEKESSSDLIDDLKISYSDYKLCFQIKHTKTNRSLTFNDIKSMGELDLSKLCGHYILESKNVEYYFILKWGNPTNDKINNYLEEETHPRYAFIGSKTYRIKPEAYEELKNEIEISQSVEIVEKFFTSIHFVCNTPTASLNINSPDLLESELETYAKKLEVDQYPNNKTISVFLTQLVDFVCKMRSAPEFEILQNDMMRELDIRTDYGSIPQKFLIDETKKILLSEKIEEFHKFSVLNRKIIIEGEPGSGKSYFITEYIDYLNEKAIKYAHHYFFVGNNDNLAAKRINHNTLVGNLIKEIYTQFPHIERKHNSEFSATITKLNELLSEINEPFYIILDGIDHFYRTYLNNIDEDVINVIKSIIIPSTVNIILVSQPIKGLNDDSFYVYSMPSWNLALTKEYADKSGMFLDESEIVKIHNLSKGNPLYTEYILNCLKTGNDTLDSLPIYSSSIETYYEYLFNRINDNELFGIMAVIPFLFMSNDIVEISNRGDFARTKFNELLPVLKYLPLKGGYCIYHESLKRFIYDHCEEHGIDLKRIKKSIFEWLTQKEFYQNEKAYIFALPLAVELKQYEWGASLIGFDFLFNSLYHGYALRTIKDNLEAIKQCICELNDEKKFATYILVDEIIQQNGDRDGNFLSTNANEYFKAYLTLFGQSGSDKLLYRHNLTGDTYNKLVYNAYINKYINHPIDMVQTDEKYSQYEENTVSKIYAAYLINNVYSISDTRQPLSEEYLFYIAYELISRRDKDFIENYCTNDKSVNSYNLKRMLNALNCFSYYYVLLKYDIDYDYDLSKSNEIVSKVIDFISYSRTQITKEEISKIHTCAADCFMFSFFEYIININDALKTEDVEVRDKLIVKALNDFINVCQPFNGKLRSMDLSMPLFRKIFLFQLLTPINCIKDTYLQLDFIKGILNLYDKIGATITGSQIGCIVLFEIIDELPIIAKVTDQEQLINIFENRINTEKEASLYDYISSYYFSLSSVASKIGNRKAEEYFKYGISYSLSYGFHKDAFLYDVFDSYKAIEGLIVSKEEILKTLGNMAYGMHYHTDGRSTRKLPVTWINAYLRYSVTGAIDYISNAQLQSKSKSWLYDSMIAECISFIENDIDIELLYHIITCYQIGDFDFNIYIRLIDKLIKNNLASLAENLISYVVGINERQALENENNYNLLKELSVKINYTLPLFRKVTVDNEPYKEPISPVPSVEEIIANPRLVWNLKGCDLIDIVNRVSYNEDTKQLIVDIFYESRLSERSCEEINKLIDETIADNDKKVFVYMCVFVIWKRGLYEQFAYVDSVKAALKISVSQVKRAFFEIINRLKGHENISFYSVGNYLNYLVNINCASQELLDIWGEVWEFANRRLPDLRQEICEIKKSNVELNNISNQLIIANINNYSEDNYRRTLCYIKKCIDNCDSYTGDIVDFVFSNWTKINIVAKLSFVYELCFSNGEALALAENYRSLIVNDDNILIAAIGAKVFGKNINYHEVDLSSIASCSPISYAEIEYIRQYIFNYDTISSFCQYFGIDETKILNYHKVNRGKYQDYTNRFWSNHYKVFSDNTIIYNSFLESIDIVIKDSYNHKLISLEDVYKLSLELAYANRIAFIQPTMFMKKREDEVVLAQFKSDLIHDYQNGSTNKVVYRCYQLKLNDRLFKLIENNLVILDKGLSYTKQISFKIIESLLDNFNWTYDIVEGNDVILDENDKIIGRYITNKYGLLGLDNCSEQIYKYQEGILLITSTAFNKLKDLFDSPNSNLLMSDYKTFILHTVK